MIEFFLSVTDWSLRYVFSLLNKLAGLSSLKIKTEMCLLLHIHIISEKVCKLFICVNRVGRRGFFPNKGDPWN